MTGFDVLKAVSAVLVLIASICFLYQFVYLILPFITKPKPHKENKLHRYAILIAARNEEAVLPHLLDSIHSQDYPAELLTTYVVADNCTDATAEVAEAHGARVFSRFNKEKVGKGYAMNYLLEQIRTADGLEQYDAFLVFDADNLLEKDFVSQINRLCADGYDAFCGYRNSKNFGDSWISAGHGMWYLHESTHMNRSRMRIGSCCAVNGTGFGFTRQLLEALGGWNFFTLTEDIEFSVRCATEGYKVGYCHDAVFYDEQPISFRQSWKQRTRWAQGGCQISVKYALNYLKGILKGGRTGYASYEMATLSLWGYGFAGFSYALSMLLAFIESGWSALLWLLLPALVGSYVSMLAMGAWTMLTEWKRVRATKAQKLGAIFAYPIYMMTYVPIAITSVFRKFHWVPIEHTVAISASHLREK